MNNEEDDTKLSKIRLIFQRSVNVVIALEATEDSNSISFDCYSFFNFLLK